MATPVELPEVRACFTCVCLVCVCVCVCVCVRNINQTCVCGGRQREAGDRIGKSGRREMRLGGGGGSDDRRQEGGKSARRRGRRQGVVGQGSGSAMLHKDCLSCLAHLLHPAGRCCCCYKRRTSDAARRLGQPPSRRLPRTAARSSWRRRWTTTTRSVGVRLGVCSWRLGVEAAQGCHHWYALCTPHHRNGSWLLPGLTPPSLSPIFPHPLPLPTHVCVSVQAAAGQVAALLAEREAWVAEQVCVCVCVGAHVCAG